MLGISGRNKKKGLCYIIFACWTTQRSMAIICKYKQNTESQQNKAWVSYVRNCCFWLLIKLKVYIYITVHTVYSLLAIYSTISKLISVYHWKERISFLFCFKHTLYIFIIISSWLFCGGVQKEHYMCKIQLFSHLSLIKQERASFLTSFELQSGGKNPHQSQISSTIAHTAFLYYLYNSL